MGIRKHAAIAFAGSFLLLGITPASSQNAALANVTRQVADSCKLQGWQYALRFNPDHLVKVELSPSLSAKQVACVYNILDAYKFPVVGGKHY